MKRYNYYIKKTSSNLEYHEDCAKRAEYFKKWDNHTSQHNNWTSAQYYKSREEDKRIQEEKTKKQENLQRRRQKLTDLFRNETYMYNQELNSQRDSYDLDLGKLRSRHHEILEHQESARKAEAELHLYHQWRRDEPAVREAESSFRRGFVRQAWDVQREEKHSAEETARRESERLAEEERLSALRARVESEDAERTRQAEERRVAEINLEQVIQKLREKESLSEDLLREEASSAKMEQELLRLDRQREAQEKLRKQTTYRSGLEHQVAFRLRQRAQQVQRELEEDRALLQAVQRATDLAASHEAEQRQARVQLSNQLRVMADQQEREARMARDHAHMFHEEAVSTWRMSEERWAKEKAARSALLSAVLAQRQAQVRERRDRARRERQQLQEECEALHRASEEHRRLQEKREELDRIDKTNYQKLLQNQMSERLARQAMEETKKKAEEEERKKLAIAEAARINSELRKITSGARRPAWM